MATIATPSRTSGLAAITASRIPCATLQALTAPTMARIVGASFTSSGVSAMTPLARTSAMITATLLMTGMSGTTARTRAVTALTRPAWNASASALARLITAGSTGTSRGHQRRDERPDRPDELLERVLQVVQYPAVVHQVERLAERPGQDADRGRDHLHQADDRRQPAGQVDQERLRELGDDLRRSAVNAGSSAFTAPIDRT